FPATIPHVVGLLATGLTGYHPKHHPNE
ncbi:MAG: hypothetical protein QOI78_1688, partial [Actinomycetota bacterium]|nr:hypothetical protein [Actinomycetota bacterium]